ncbi:cytochrome-c peroxidase [Thalassotalea sediminis]|uniref:cytochrome-c peroxidase n=1 Tax=Thalassotalea sediminis TaxID=1759089 RepID=UPI0025746DAE|nr:cytochrome c peroxidase [Thalassotalea sediminis]
MQMFKCSTRLIVLIVIMLQGQVNANSSTISLSKNCPPSFELSAKGECKLLNLYQFYSSVQGRGVGGTQTSLPDHRDGFTPSEIDLGRYLFFDPLLSKDGSLSCASCHQPDKGFSDQRDRSIGVTGEKVARSAPTLWNVAFLDKFFWDARAKTLEEQAIGPLFDPKEMGNTPTKLLTDINRNSTYKKLFKQVFPSSESISVANITRALAAFQSSLISLNSRYDRYAHGAHNVLTEREIAGMNVFRSFVARCAECHQPPLFTNNQVAVIGTPEPEGLPFDVGAEKTFNAKKLRGGFKVPTLRNITKTAPYMHSGRFDNLFDSVEFYTKGRGHAVPKDESLQLHWHIWEPDLTKDEIQLIVEFLGTLTDESLTPQIPLVVPSGLPVIDQEYQSSITKHNNNSSATGNGE